MKKLLALVLVLVVAGLAWALYQRGAAPGAHGPEGSAAARDLLTYIPADAPFAIASLQPAPKAVVEQTMAASAGIVEAYRQGFLDVRKKIAAQDGDNPETQRALAMFDALEQEFAGKTPQQIAEHLGLSLQSRSAFYGLGLLPVLRIQLGDMEKMRGFVERMQALAGSELVERPVGDEHYWTLPQPDLKVQPALALIDGQLILTALPADADDATARRILGIDRPARSMADDNRLQRLADEMHYTPYAVGFVDSLALIDAFTRDDDAVKASFLKALEVEAPELDATCLAEARRIAGAWPRISLGLTQFDLQGSSALTVVHTDPAIAAELKKLRAPMPGGPGREAGTVFDFGLSLALNQLPAVVTALANQISAQPFACEAFAGLNTSAEQAKLGINQPMLFAAAPVFSGLRVAIDAFELDPATMQPTMTGTTLIASDHPDSLIGMARSAIPQLADVQLGAAGEVVALPAMPGAQPGQTVHAARGEKLIGLAVGDAAADTLPQRLKSDPGYQPLLHVAAGSRIYEVIADGIDQVVEAMPEGEERDELALQATLMRASYAKTFKGSAFRMELTDRGIEFIQDAEFVQP